MQDLHMQDLHMQDLHFTVPNTKDYQLLLCEMNRATHLLRLSSAIYF